MAQGALGAAGVRRVGYGLDVGRSGRGGAYFVATCTACYGAWTEKLERRSLRGRDKSFAISFVVVDAIHECDVQTDRHRPITSTALRKYYIASRGKYLVELQVEFVVLTIHKATAL